MTFWEWDAAYSIYLKSNGIEDKEKINIDEARELVRNNVAW
jgi:hypothetical protein